MAWGSRKTTTWLCGGFVPVLKPAGRALWLCSDGCTGRVVASSRIMERRATGSSEGRTLATRGVVPTLGTSTRMDWASLLQKLCAPAWMRSLSGVEKPVRGIQYGQGGGPRRMLRGQAEADQL